MNAAAWICPKCSAACAPHVERCPCYQQPVDAIAPQPHYPPARLIPPAFVPMKFPTLHPSGCCCAECRPYVGSVKCVAGQMLFVNAGSERYQSAMGNRYSWN